MLINELKCLEVLLRHISNNSDLNREVTTEFTDINTFNESKLNLFNQITINSLIKNYQEDLPFSLESFLYTGIIPNMYDERIDTPTVDKAFQSDYKRFYQSLLTSLKEGNYTFDDNNNIYISSESLETIVPASWLYRLSIACKKSSYEQIYFYNKNIENNITDKESLIKYLLHTKTFDVKLTSSNPNHNLKQVFDSIKDKVNKKLQGQKVIKVDDIIALFKENTPKDCQITISKYKLFDALWLVYKAESKGNEFYTQPLEIQKQLLNNWSLEYINSNEIANNETQLYLLSDFNKKVKNHKINKKNIIAGLFNLYISILASLDIDLDFTSLSDFKIETYMSEELQSSHMLLKSLIKDLNKEQSNCNSLIEQASQANTVETSYSTESSTDLLIKKANYEMLRADIKEKENHIGKLNAERNQLQSRITEEQKISIANIAFDNKNIIDLILKATQEGRIYFNQRENKLYIEIYNNELGKTIFKVSISFQNLITLIENINYNFEETYITKR